MFWEQILIMFSLTYPMLKFPYKKIMSFLVKDICLNFVKEVKCILNKGNIVQ